MRLLLALLTPLRLFGWPTQDPSATCADANFAFSTTHLHPVTASNLKLE